MFEIFLTGRDIFKIAQLLREHCRPNQVKGLPLQKIHFPGPFMLAVSYNPVELENL